MFTKSASILLLGLLAVGCTPNAPYRTAGLADCPSGAAEPNHDCAPTTFIERHEGYDLAFVEFTERGNVFRRDRMQQVLDLVNEQAESDEGVIAIVFVHGWKHNAAADDGNVRSFRELLHKASQLSLTRRVVGVYVGWRGLSIDWGPLTNVSYWERKAAAEQVAKGGVTELLLRLEREVIDDREAQGNRNLYLVTGHSFGGAVALAALNEIMLERVADAVEHQDGCVVSRPFGHGMVLLNPAIEADQILQLKELVAENCFLPSQQRLMHVISSDADEATNKSFRIGQWLGVNLTWKQTGLTRWFPGRQESLELQESELDTITVGNFKPFQTGQLDRSNEEGTRWRYRSCVGAEPLCLAEADRAQHVPARPNEPLAFIHTDSAFIKNHNDVFNDNVSAYLGAIMGEARYKRMLADALIDDPGLPAECRSENFGTCFAFYQEAFEKLADAAPEPDTL